MLIVWTFQQPDKYFWKLSQPVTKCIYAIYCSCWHCIVFWLVLTVLPSLLLALLLLCARLSLLDWKLMCCCLVFPLFVVTAFPLPYTLCSCILDFLFCPLLWQLNQLWLFQTSLSDKPMWWYPELQSIVEF